MEQYYNKLIVNVANNGYLVVDPINGNTINIFGYQIKHNLQEGIPLDLNKITFELIREEILSQTKGNKLKEFIEVIKNITKGSEIKAATMRYKDTYSSFDNLLFNLQPLNFIERQEFAPEEARKRIRLYPESQPDDILNDYEVPKYKLSCQVFEDSSEITTDVPFNTAFFALLTSLIAQVTNTIPGDLIHTFSTVYIYTDNVEEATKDLTNPESEPIKLQINPSITDINQFTEDDIKIIEN